MIASERVYTMRSSQRIVAIVLAAVALVVVVAVWYAVLSDRQKPDFFAMIFPVVFLLFTVGYTIRTFHNSFLLSAQQIELRGLRGTRTLPLNKIRGRRRYIDSRGEGSPVPHLVIESNDDLFPKLDIEELYRFDDEFYAWFNALPDLDELDKTRHKPSNFGLA